MTTNPYATPKVDSTKRPLNWELRNAYEHESPNLESIATDAAQKFPFLLEEDPTRHNILNDRKRLFSNGTKYTENEKAVTQFLYGYDDLPTQYNIINKVSNGFIAGSLVLAAYCGLNETVELVDHLPVVIVAGGFGVGLKYCLNKMYNRQRHETNAALQRSHDIIKKTLK